MKLHFLNDVVSDIELTRKSIKLYVIIASLKTEPTCKLINRIPGLRLLISSKPGKASRMHVESFCKPHDSTSSRSIVW